MKYRITSLIAFTLIMLCGCDKFETSYGTSKGTVGKRSINGFGALRKSYELSGYQTRDVRSFNTRVRKSQTIVWTPQIPNPIAGNVTQWLESWMRSGDNTLVYIVPDSGSEADYWTKARAKAPSNQKLEYRRRSARQKNERMEWDANRIDITSNGWFVAKPKTQFSRAGSLVEQNWELDGSLNSADALVRTEYILEPYVKPAAGTAMPAAPFGNGKPVGPGGANFNFAPPGKMTTSSATVTFTPLLKADSGDTIVAEITSRTWSSSRILVVAGGSLLTNYAFADDFSVQLADKVVKHSKGSKQIDLPVTRDSAIAGFLTSHQMPISVRNSKNNVPKSVGAELFLVWPLSLVTVHAVLLGIVVCAIMFPIFGRAKSMPQKSTSNFGDHLDAVATLMNSSRGEKYARNRISEYMRRMKGESEGKWVIPNEPKESKTATPVAASDNTREMQESSNTNPQADQPTKTDSPSRLSDELDLG